MAWSGCDRCRRRKAQPLLFFVTFGFTLLCSSSFLVHPGYPPFPAALTSQPRAQLPIDHRWGNSASFSIPMIKTNQARLSSNSDFDEEESVQNELEGLVPRFSERESSDQEFQLNSTTLSKKVYSELMSTYDEQVPGPDPSKPPARALPINLDLMTYHARQAMIKGDEAVGLRIYKKCLELDPRDGRAWLALARHESRRKRFEVAEKLFLKGLTYSRGNPYLLQAYGVMEEQRGNSVKALELYSKATLADPKHAASYVAKAKLLQGVGKVQEARRALKSAVYAQPDSYYAYQVWAVLEHEEGELQLARELFQKAAAANPRNAATFQAWGLLEAGEGQLELARALFARGLEENPRSVWTLQAWSVVEARLGDGEAAERLLGRALEAAPRAAPVLQTAALRRQREGRPREARALFERATRADPAHAPSWVAWGLMEAELGRVDRARELFQQGAWGCPEGRQGARLWQAWALLEAAAGRPADARRCFRHAVRRARPTPRGLVPVLLAWALAEGRLGAHERARQLMDLAVTYDPANAQLWRLYEEMEAGQGYYAEAARVAARGRSAAGTTQWGDAARGGAAAGAAGGAGTGEGGGSRGGRGPPPGPRDAKSRSAAAAAKGALLDAETWAALEASSREIEAALARVGVQTLYSAGLLLDDELLSYRYDHLKYS